MNDHDLEKQAVAEFVAIALADGYAVSVYDGEETTVTRSKDRQAIINALFTTDSDTLKLRSDDGKITASFQFIYGNGVDVLSDYSDTATGESFANRFSDIVEPLFA